MQTGRPTSYSDGILALAEDYVDHGYLGTEDDPESGEPVPTVAGLSLAMGVARSTVYDWAGQEDKKEFSDIVDDLMAKQEMRLLRGGITGVYNSSITKLALTKHGYSDKSDNTIANPDGSNVSLIFSGVPGGS